MTQEQNSSAPISPALEPKAPQPTFDPSLVSGQGQHGVEPRPAAQPEAPDAQGWWWGTGRRKAAVARVRIKPGTGKMSVRITRKSEKSIEEYFTELQDRQDVQAPLLVTGLLGKMDVSCRCNGGGRMGQAQAIRLGIARAIKKFDPSHESVLRDNGHLTRDDREVERKKYGQAGARRRFQFSKR
jgi:small subunit ribosomal protein S9